MPQKSQIPDICAEEAVSLVRLLYVDSAGVTRGRVVDAADIDRVLETGANLAQAQQAFTVLEYPVPAAPFDPVGEIRLVPDSDTFRLLPYADRAAVMLCDMYTLDQTPWEADPRSRLRAFLEDLPFVPQAAFESEFYLAERRESGLEPLDSSGCFTADGMQSAHPIILDAVDALKAQGMEIATYYPEYGPGQQELVIDHTPGLRAPDEYTLYKLTVKAIAEAHGLEALFVPKPFREQPGSGCHVHLSLWDDEQNAFHGDGEEGAYGLSDLAHHFIGGLIEHAPALLALTAPTPMSYKRLQPDMWASAYTCWGLDNREAMIRVPSADWEDPSSSTRIEFKPVDNTVNPYLVLLGLLAAGRDGIENELDPGPPVERNPAELGAEERAERGIERYPRTLGEAIERLADDEVLEAALGPLLYEPYLDIKRELWSRFSGSVTDWEIDNLRGMY